jgi:hypothetical protein
LGIALGKEPTTVALGPTTTSFGVIPLSPVAGGRSSPSPSLLGAIDGEGMVGDLAGALGDPSTLSLAGSRDE